MYEISEHKNSLGRLLMVNASSVKPSNNNQDFFLALLLLCWELNQSECTFLMRRILL